MMRAAFFGLGAFVALTGYSFLVVDKFVMSGEHEERAKGFRGMLTSPETIQERTKDVFDPPRVECVRADVRRLRHHALRGGTSEARPLTLRHDDSASASLQIQNDPAITWHGSSMNLSVDNQRPVTCWSRSIPPAWPSERHPRTYRQ